MILIIERPDGTETVLFGVNDYGTGTANGTPFVEVWFHSDVESANVEQRQTFDGEIDRGLREGARQKADVVNILGDFVHREDTTVIIGLTDIYPETKRAYIELLADDDINVGDTTVFGETSLTPNPSPQYPS